MLALLVKPAAWKKSKHAKILHELEFHGAHIIQSHTADDIKHEIQGLQDHHADITVVACGGDGTVHLLVNAIYDLPVTLAVLPMGTGNDFARYLGVRNLETALDLLQDTTAAQFDVGTIALSDGTVRHFVGITSCGFDAQVNERANTYRGPQGTAKYIAALLGELKALKSLSLDINVDGEIEHREVMMLAIGNTNSYGGGMKVCPQADAQDGEFSVISVAKVSRSLLLRVFPRVFAGTHINHPKVSSFVAREIRIDGDSFAIYADGERVGNGPARISITPQALLVKAK